MDFTIRLCPTIGLSSKSVTDIVRKSPTESGVEIKLAIIELRPVDRVWIVQAMEWPGVGPNTVYGEDERVHMS